MSISLVLPTYNRLDALKTTLPLLRLVRGIDEIVVVVDGSIDHTIAWLDEIDDPRLVVIVHPRNLGAPAARNTGVEAATSQWILMAEDDIGIPHDFIAHMTAAAAATGADIVCAPWLHPPANASPDDLCRLATQLRTAPSRAFSLETHPSTFPADDIDTPFVNGIILARRETMQSVQYDPYFSGNAYREETDFALRAVQAGYRCVLTPRTYSYQVNQWSGGQRQSAFRYELSTAINNWKFLRRHGTWLTRAGYIRGPFHASASHVWSRVKRLIAHRARWIVARDR